MSYNGLVSIVMPLIIIMIMMLGKIILDLLFKLVWRLFF